MKAFKGAFSSIIMMLLIVFVACNNKEQKASEKDLAKSDNYRVAIELILDSLDQKDELIAAFKHLNLEAYRWKKHIVLFGKAEDTTGFDAVLKQNGVRVKTKIYANPIYAFDKWKHCDDTLTADKWRNYLLTANLVNDSLKQQEYIHYHAIQFEEWPEIAQGFCKANFQQLLVYKNGRQLLLVISIPANKTLDELNPLTVENNPRMVEWNNIMGTYQEGIKGTDENETWVFMEKKTDH